MRYLLAREPRSQIFKGRQTGIRRPLLAVTLNQVPVATANRTEPETPLATQGLHRQGQRRLRLDENADVDLVLVVEVDVQVVRGQLDAVGGGRTRGEPDVEDGGDRDGHRLKTPAARLRHRRADLARHEDLGPVSLQAKLDPLEPPRRVSEDGPERPHFGHAEPLFRYVGNPNDHER